MKSMTSPKPIVWLACFELAAVLVLLASCISAQWDKQQQRALDGRRFEFVADESALLSPNRPVKQSRQRSLASPAGGYQSRLINYGHMLDSGARSSARSLSSSSSRKSRARAARLSKSRALANARRLQMSSKRKRRSFLNKLSPDLVTPEPTHEPAPKTSEKPTLKPTERPTAKPTQEPTYAPTKEPAKETTNEPTQESEEAEYEPTHEPTQKPVFEPTSEPTQGPAYVPTQAATLEPVCKSHNPVSAASAQGHHLGGTTLKPSYEAAAKPVADYVPEQANADGQANSKLPAGDYQQQSAARVPEYPKVVAEAAQKAPSGEYQKSASASEHQNVAGQPQAKVSSGEYQQSASNVSEYRGAGAEQSEKVLSGGHQHQQVSHSTSEYQNTKHESTAEAQAPVYASEYPSGEHSQHAQQSDEYQEQPSYFVPPPTKCRSKIDELSHELKEAKALAHRLAKKVHSAKVQLEHAKRDLLLKKLVKIRGACEESLMAADFNNVHTLNESAKTAGIELIRLSQIKAALHLEPHIKRLAAKLRRVYGHYRKSCKHVSSEGSV